MQLLWALLAALTLAGLSVVLGQCEFGSYDASMLIDLGWRLQQGQMPYRDFPCMLPPDFYLAAWAAMHCLGVHWWAFTVTESCFFVGLAVVGALVISQMVEDRWLRRRVWLLYLLAASLPMLLTNHLWHAVLASQETTTLLLFYFLFHRYRSAPRTWRCVVGMALVVLTSLLVLTKPNWGAAALVSAAWFVLCSSTRRWAAVIMAACTVAGAVGAMLLLQACSISWQDVWHSYHQVSERPSAFDALSLFLNDGMDWTARIDAPVSYAVVALLLFAALWHLVCYPALWRTPQCAAALAGLGVTAVGFATDWDIRGNALGPACFGLGLFLLVSDTANMRVPKACLRVALTLTIGAVILLAGVRARMRQVGAWAGDSYGILQRQTDPFFGAFVARQTLWQVNQQIDALHAAYPGAAVFFGQRLEFEYARLGVLSPRHMPIWWHPGSAYPVAAEAGFALEMERHHFDFVVLEPSGKASGTRMPTWFFHQLETQYRRVSAPGSAVTVYRRIFTAPSQ